MKLRSFSHSNSYIKRASILWNKQDTQEWLKEHPHNSELNVAWTDMFSIYFENCLYLVLLPLFGEIDNPCSERIQNPNRGNAKGLQRHRTEHMDVSSAPWASTDAKEFPILWLQVRYSILQYHNGLPESPCPSHKWGSRNPHKKE